VLEEGAEATEVTADRATQPDEGSQPTARSPLSPASQGVDALPGLLISLRFICSESMLKAPSPVPS
jgi:hypothetical protein